jgi:hypothetical protein
MQFTTKQMQDISRMADRLASAANMLMSDPEKCNQANLVSYLITEMRMASQLVNAGQAAEATERLMSLFAQEQTA